MTKRDLIILIINLILLGIIIYLLFSSTKEPFENLVAVRSTKGKDDADDEIVNIQMKNSGGSLRSDSLAGGSLRSDYSAGGSLRSDYSAGGSLAGGSLAGGSLAGGSLAGGSLRSDYSAGGSLAESSLAESSLAESSLLDDDDDDDIKVIRPRKRRYKKKYKKVKEENDFENFNNYESEMSPRDKNLFDAIKKGKLSDQEIQQLIDSDVITENLVEKFLQTAESGGGGGGGIEHFSNSQKRPSSYNIGSYNGGSYASF